MPPILAAPLRPRGRRLLLRPQLPRLLLLLSRSIHSPTPTTFDLDITHPTYMIWGANTGVGKTLVSAGLAASVLSPLSATPSSFLYLKPVQTGFPRDSDARFVYRKVSDLFRRGRDTGTSSLLASNHALTASAPAALKVLGAGIEQVDDEGSKRGLCSYEEMKIGGGPGEFKLVCKTLYGWNEAISPHLTAEREGMVVDDSLLRDVLGRCLALGGGKSEVNRGSWSVIETAGGVASPGPSGTLQCDLYRPFRLPAVLVGDGRLGGISATISAYETLKLRGYDVIAVILEDHHLSNEMPLLSYLRNRVHVLVLPPVPQDMKNNLMDWFSESSKIFGTLQEMMQSAHLSRIHRLHTMPQKAGEILWWPFTQHNLVPEENVTVIDSRCGENFAIHKVCDDWEMIVPQFDACASWWTQGPNVALQMELARDMGYSAARYGHVMYPENVYEPALRCAELLLEGVGKGWASRAFYSDNGSTSIEIALKMAFRKFSFDHGIYISYGNDISNQIYEFKVLALSGSYHGDTLGAMEAQAPSTYTSFSQQPWYSGRGLFLDPPTVFICNEVWSLSIPYSLYSGQMCREDLRFSSCDELFCQSRDSSTLARIYSAYIAEHLLPFSGPSCATRIGALIIEPVIHGAGGMHMIDPLFQRVLVKECRTHKIPVIFDEVFTGFWRLGRESATELLGCFPDIACYAKLLTGGIVPLAVTLATEAVFEAFKGDSKAVALLHGHSYSAHAMGCTAAVKAMQWFKDPSTNHNFDLQGNKLKELWDMKIVLQISSIPAVARIISLGTVCAIEVKAEDNNAGYTSLQVSPLVQKLREDGIYMRPLGNVIYLMCGPCTSPDVCTLQLNQVYHRLCEFSDLCIRNKEKASLSNSS